MKPEDGGAAFPRPSTIPYQSDFPAQTGMTLRQWFAGQALAGFPATAAHVDVIAKACYQLADAMIAEGAKD